MSYFHKNNQIVFLKSYFLEKQSNHVSQMVSNPHIRTHLHTRTQTYTFARAIAYISDRTEDIHRLLFDMHCTGALEAWCVDEMTRLHDEGHAGWAYNARCADDLTCLNNAGRADGAT